MLFGRSAERAQLEQLLDAAASGAVGCILEGTAGIGKTSLWRESVESARKRDYRVLETAPSEPESLLAFSGLGDLFERLPDDVLETLPEAQADALKAALLLGESPEGSRHQQALPRAILGVLRQVAVDGPVVVAIDDEQWLDPASARVLAFALSRLREEPIAVILARRPEPRGGLSAELRRRFHGGGLETISLESLPMSTIKMLLEARLKRSISRPLLRRIHQGAGGNPLYVLAIATELEARHADGDRAGDLPITGTLADAIELRLAHLDPRADAAMLAIASLSQPTLALLQAAIPDFALSDLESAERAGVIEISGGRLRFTHPLLASTHYGNTPVSKRRELHRLLATVIEDEEERAQHVALGAEAPDRDIADTLESAARVAARRGATESAAQLLEDAARLTPIDHPLAESARIVAAAKHRFSSGDVSRARDMLEEAIPDLAAGPLRVRAQLQLALIRGDEPRVAVELLEAALADAGEDYRLRVEIEAELTTATCDVGRLGSARAYAESAVRTAERLGDADLLARALGELLVTCVTTGEPLRPDVLRRLSAMEDSTATTTYNLPTTTIGLALHWAGDSERARPMLERAAQRALSRGEEWDRLGLLLSLSQLEWELGDQAIAEQHLHAAEEGLGEYSEGLIWLLGLEARYALEKGDLTAARATVGKGLALAEQTAAVWQAARLNPVLAAVELLSGQPDVAHTRLKDEREWLQSIGFGPAGYNKTVVWSLDLEALIALGRLDEAEDVLAELRSRADACGSDIVRAIAARCDGLLLAARGELIAALDAIERAVGAHLRCRRPFEHGRTLLEKGSIERRARHKAAAKQTLEQALGILEPLGAEIWVARARDELSRIGLRPAKATEGLTAAQARVADLVVAGLTNPQIARQLHMGLRTVESHLSRVYRECGVSSRSQLVAALGAPQDRSPVATSGRGVS
jgi:DNA-binding CsgD family transcriptional regulator